jgi:hypothetical protein
MTRKGSQALTFVFHVWTRQSEPVDDVWETGIHLSELETWSCYFEVSHQIEG